MFGGLSHTVTKYTLISWAGLIILLLVEHLLLTYVYRKPSSLKRIFTSRTASTKTDIIMAAFGYGILYAFAFLRRYLYYLFIPGAVYLILLWVKREYGINGLFPSLVPKNPILAIAFWLLLADFTIYVAHWCMHRVPFLWRFHQLHHSATEMNIITGMRVSLGERGINSAVSFFILYIFLGVASPAIMYPVFVIQAVVDRLQHSDIPWDYGPLNYLIASPRFHRIHHSAYVEDYDANYANIFSIWDYVFRTVSPRYAEDRRNADDCPLGLGDSQLEAKQNRWYFALFQDTFPHLVWLGVSYVHDLIWPEQAKDKQPPDTERPR